MLPAVVQGRLPEWRVEFCGAISLAIRQRFNTPVKWVRVRRKKALPATAGEAMKPPARVFVAKPPKPRRGLRTRGRAPLLIE